MRKGCLSSDVEGGCAASVGQLLACQVGPRFHYLLGGNSLSITVFSMALVRMDWTSQYKTTACQLPGGVSLANSVASPCFSTEILYSRSFFTWFFVASIVVGRSVLIVSIVEEVKISVFFNLICTHTYGRGCRFRDFLAK